MNRPLTRRQEAFVWAYLRSLNPEAAAREAGYSPAAASHAHTLLRRPAVAERVARAMDKRASRLELSADDVLKMVLADREKARELGQMGAALTADALLMRHLRMFPEQRRGGLTMVQVQQFAIADAAALQQEGFSIAQVRRILEALPAPEEREDA